MSLFFLELIPVCTAMFYYVIWRFFVIFGNNSKLIPLVVAIILAILIMGTFMYQGNNKILDIIGTIGSWVVVLGFLLTIILLVEHTISIWYKINPRIITGIIVLTLGLGVYFSLHTKITNLNIQSDKIKEDTKILLISDIHVENITQDFHVKKILKTIESEKPDFVIIAGDLMNKPNNTYVNYFSAFKSVKDTPIFAVEGNHDVMGNTEIIEKISEVSGIKILNNESIEINGIQLIGITDKSLRGNQTVKEIMNKSNLNKISDLFSILITHQPISLEKLKDYPIDLEVAGHTHKGQFYGIMELSRMANDYLYGENKLGDKTAFVTQGIGTRGLPFRLGTQSEMVIINLIKK